MQPNPGVKETINSRSSSPLSFSPDHIQVFVVGGVPLFFCQRDGPWFPTLRLLHQYPDMMPKLRADKGAIKFVLSGAHIMCPGLTSPGATIEAEVRRGKERGSVHAVARAFTPRSRSSLSHTHARTSPLFCSHPQADVDAPVAIYAEGKDHAMAVGLTKLSTADIRAVNKGIGVENIHYLNDGLWKEPAFAA